MTDVIPAGQVTLADLFHVLTTIQTGQSDMATKQAEMATQVAVIASRNTDAAADLADHEARIRALEVWRWKLAGVAFVVAVLVGIAAAWIENKMR